MSIAFQKAPGVPGNGKLALSAIRIGGGTQSREKLSPKVVKDYMEALAEGAVFPPVVVFHDGEVNWLADGFHRVEVHRKSGKKNIAVDVRQGTQRDAILYSVGANETHGFRRSNEDKRRAVLMLLNDEEWSQWTDREIARRCLVGHPLVASLRASVTGRTSSDERTFTTKHGTTATMKTAGINACRAKPEEAAEPEEEPQAEPAAARLDPAPSSAGEGAFSPAVEAQRAQRQAAVERHRQARKADTASGLVPEDRIAELEEAVRTLEADNADLDAENKLFGEMRIQWEQGGFAKVVAGKDEEIRVLQTRLYRESEEKIANLRRGDRFLKILNDQYHHFKDQVIDPKTGEVSYG